MEDDTEPSTWHLSIASCWIMLKEATASVDIHPTLASYSSK